jgi:hypothetical protein
MGMIITKGNKFYINVDSIRKFPWVIDILKRDNFRCVKCNSGDVEKLIIHHIDGSRKDGIGKMNNNPENLQTLCKSCHAEAHQQKIQFKNPNLSNIQELRNQGKTFAEIGKYLGISRQRVHQIVKKITP